jgi:hypothetical protein
MMSKADLFGAIFSLIWGICALAFYKPLAHRIAEFQYHLLGIRYNEKISQIVLLLVGTFLLIFGLLAISGIIKFKT